MFEMEINLEVELWQRADFLRLQFPRLLQLRTMMPFTREQLGLNETESGDLTPEMSIPLKSLASPSAQSPQAVSNNPV